MKIEIAKIFGLLVFLIGVIFSLNSSMSFTGGFIGSGALIHSLSFFLGIAFLILGIIIFSTSSLYHQNTAPSLEQRAISKPYLISSSIKAHPSLLRLTEDTVEDPVIEREMNHLIEELSKGNIQAGLGHPGHIQGTKINYLRGRNGARLLFQQKGKDKYEIVAKASKKNEQQVIDALKKVYKK
jgi:hypothetical protein